MHLQHIQHLPHLPHSFGAAPPGGPVVVVTLLDIFDNTDGDTIYPFWTVSSGAAAGTLYVDGVEVGTGAPGTVGYFAVEGVHEAWVVVNGVPSNHDTFTTASAAQTVNLLDVLDCAVDETIYPFWEVNHGDATGQLYIDGSSVGPGLPGMAPYTATEGTHEAWVILNGGAESNHDFFTASPL